MNQFIIRDAQERDTGLIVDMIRELAEYEKMDGDCVVPQETLRKSLFEEKSAAALIGELDGSPVGYALYFENFSTFLGKAGIYIEDIYVREAFRGRGFGRQFFRRVAQIAEQRGCERIDWACLKWNTPSRQFYEGLGAMPHEEWLTYRLEKDSIARLAED